MFRIWAIFEPDSEGAFIAVAALDDFLLNQFLVSLTVPLGGLPDAAALLCRPYPDMMVKDRTADRWVQRHTSKLA